MSKTPKSGRLVWNHSTHIPGLIPILTSLTTYPGIETITPGVISRSKGQSPHLQLRLSVPIRGGYKIIARQGKTVQEVFIITTLSREEIEGAIASILSK